MAATDDAHPGVAPYLIVKNASAAIAFYTKAFGAREHYRLAGANGHIGHAELELAGGIFMLADESPSFGALSPPTIGGSPVKMHIHVDDVDAVVARASALGATVLRPVQDQFYGERSGMIVDPFGHQWFVATHKENISPEVMRKRYAEMLGEAG